MKLELYIQNTENITPISVDDMDQIREIVQALIQTGGLTRVKGGQTSIHFDQQGNFQKIEQRFFPYMKRKKVL